MNKNLNNFNMKSPGSSLKNIIFINWKFNLWKYFFINVKKSQKIFNKSILEFFKSIFKIFPKYFSFIKQLFDLNIFDLIFIDFYFSNIFYFIQYESKYFFNLFDFIWLPPEK